MITAIEFAWRNWKLILGGLIVATLGVMLIVAKGDARHWRKMHEQEVAAHKLTVSNYRAAYEKARADALAHAAAVKARDDAIAKETQHALTTQLADAYRAADDYARRLRAATRAGQGGTGGADLSGAATAADDTAGAGEGAELDDARICARNTVIAKGWQDWWAEISAVPR
ncbi:hypothetical protein [Sphingomonas koreensis]|uniref:hypothetical protein n=1 Tax=Sphingomonas koreensis TaxID=93064 RepID=UPI000F7F85F3|nr:hypothetical protein [Sphingomonas koreensis]RSU21192.1 hypothetical protein CA224_06725 [Sphingomonas koreensis]RSU32242.1 hypothetical protein CA225_02760 [Sphingomonas koreensis]RSU35736.1 hypothetical protein BRX39_08930 [Sphingomonas koreensis]RSU49907.1 hypothetical protein CA221_12550 [Sphingomonas koreensis]RSU83504.1 hypothetical protein CA253_21410 [Sphingomonas koreensis]